MNTVTTAEYDQPVIETTRFCLRPVKTSDEGLIGHYASDKRVALMARTIPHPLPPGAAKAFVERCLERRGDKAVWVIDGTVSGGAEVMGLIALERMDRNQSEIAYWVAPPFWNTGLGSDAVKTLVAANPLGNATLFASVFQDNPASARVLTHCGFGYIGDAESFSVARNTNVKTWTYLKRMG